MELEFQEFSTVDLVDRMGRDEDIAKAALITSGQVGRAHIDGLLNRLMQDEHGSPFEHVVFKFIIDAPLFTMRQLMRHRIASWNEVSGRYKELEPRFYIPPVTRPIRHMDGTKQMDYQLAYDLEAITLHREDMKDLAVVGWDLYQRALNRGVAREMARTFLPPNIFTQAMLTINLRSLFNLLHLRGSDQSGLVVSHPQFEITQVADRMEDLVKFYTPIAHEAFVKNGRKAP